MNMLRPKIDTERSPRNISRFFSFIFFCLLAASLKGCMTFYFVNFHPGICQNKHIVHTGFAGRKPAYHGAQGGIFSLESCKSLTAVD